MAHAVGQVLSGMQGITRLSASKPVLILAAVAAMFGALAADASGEHHPTHLVVTLQAAIVLCWLSRKLGHGPYAARAILAAGLTAQPLLHFGSSVPSGYDAGLDHDGVVHLVASAMPSAIVQIAVPAVILAAVTVLAHLLVLLLRALRPSIPHAARTVVGAPLGALVSVRAAHRHTLVHHCGWVIGAARRGPPLMVLRTS